MAEILVGENEIRDLCEPVPRYRIGTDDFDVTLGVIKIGTNVLHRGSIRPLLPCPVTIHSGQLL